MNEIEVKLTVVASGSSDQIDHSFRQTRDTKYHYKFNPEIVHISAHDTKVTYRLTDCDTSRYSMANLYATPSEQLSAPSIGDKGTSISVTHSNTVQRLLNILVTVHDNTQERGLVQCDPQMTNDPPPGNCN